MQRLWRTKLESFRVALSTFCERCCSMSASVLALSALSHFSPQAQPLWNTFTNLHQRYARRYWFRIISKDSYGTLLTLCILSILSLWMYSIVSGSASSLLQLAPIPSPRDDAITATEAWHAYDHSYSSNNNNELWIVCFIIKKKLGSSKHMIQREREREAERDRERQRERVDWYLRNNRSEWPTKLCTQITTYDNVLQDGIMALDSAATAFDGFCAHRKHFFPPCVCDSSIVMSTWKT